MYIAQRTVTFVQGFLKSYGPSKIKKRLWDKEFSGTKWNFMDNTAGDCVYPKLEKYAHDGDILDLGCGPGNTANELAIHAYRSYIGVDISEAALSKAMKRTQECGRADKNGFACSDFLGYMPTKDFDVILFRESMYHIPFGQVQVILDRYSKFLKNDGVFIVRLYAADHKTGETKNRVTSKIDLINREFDVMETYQHADVGRSTVLVFRPRRKS
jgi:2-polyprenyl-6-hydroxyphenyl methylase/3-demethylubiquinone-9 3-methyltransferase